MHIFLGESDIVVYSIMGLIAVHVAFLYGLTQLGAKKKKATSYYAQSLAHQYSKGNNKIYNIIIYSWNFIEVITMIYISYVCVGLFNWGLGQVLHTGGNYFGLIFAIMLIWPVISFLFGTNPLKQLDILTPALAAFLFCIKFACFCAGCCHGIPWEHGLFNHKFNEYQVPVQLIEMFWALMIFIVLIAIRNKVKDGTIFPLYILLYSATRFFSEFLRADPNVFGIFKTYHILCLIGIMFGVLLYVFIGTYRAQINGFFDRKQEEINEKYGISEQL